MGMPKKGSSQITVDDVIYRWVVSGEDPYSKWLYVEHIDGNGQRLCVAFDEWYGDMTPGNIQPIVLAAMQDGWTPGERGKMYSYPVSCCMPS